EASPPIKSKKIFYFKEKFFTKRLLKKVEIPIQEPYIPNHGRNNAQQNPEDAKPTEDAKALEQA
ncbi:MAG: hypothetical protein HOH73_06215, partial [Alphaproteobacteria bacterium]|nr:hypothetical protein [Alphaproteobacteria bacterium]